MIQMIISGGQTGADQAGLKAGKDMGWKTGGYAPKDFLTNEGPNPDLLAGTYNLAEHKGGYKERTRENVKIGTATIRCCVDFWSAGEICTMNAIREFKKPHFDIYLPNPPSIQDFVIWLFRHQVQILNVAGNTENKRDMDIFEMSYSYLYKSFKYFDRIMKRGK